MAHYKRRSRPKGMTDKPGYSRTNGWHGAGEPRCAEVRAALNEADQVAQLDRCPGCGVIACPTACDAYSYLLGDVFYGDNWRDHIEHVEFDAVTFELDVELLALASAPAAPAPADVAAWAARIAADWCKVDE